MSQVSRRAFLAMAAMASTSWAEPKQTCVVLLLTVVITDGGWSQLAFSGLKSLGPGFKTAYAENIGLAQMQEVARGYSEISNCSFATPGCSSLTNIRIM